MLRRFSSLRLSQRLLPIPVNVSSSIPYNFKCEQPRLISFRAFASLSDKDKKRHPLLWPSTESFPVYCCNLIEAHIRHKQGELEEDKKAGLLRLTKEELHSHFFEVPWCANVKYDGTNVSISSDGSLYGRRMKIESPVYHKANVEFLHDFHPQVLDLETHILGSFKDIVSKFFVYGELVINDKFHYEKQNLLKTWIPFGISIHVTDLQNIKLVHATLQEAGFSCTLDKKVVTILLNDKLKELFLAFKFPVAETITTSKSLYDLVEESEDWLIKGNGEGIICVSQSTQQKWKIGLEHQTYAVFDLLKERTKTLAEYEDIDPRIFKVTDAIFRVKESKLCMGIEQEERPKKQEVPRKAIYDSTEVTEAIASGLTKYDSLDTYFIADKRNWIETQIIKEVEDDLIPSTATNLTARKKYIATGVRKFFNFQFGKWESNKQK